MEWWLNHVGQMAQSVQDYSSEESTEFYPSKNGEKYLIYNEYYTNKKNEGVHAKDNKNLKSILIDFNKDQVKYLKGNQFEKIKEEMKQF